MDQVDGIFLYVKVKKMKVNIKTLIPQHICLFKIAAQKSSNFNLLKYLHDMNCGSPSSQTISILGIE